MLPGGIQQRWNWNLFKILTLILQGFSFSIALVHAVVSAEAHSVISVICFESSPISVPAPFKEMIYFGLELSSALEAPVNGALNLHFPLKWD